MIDNEAVQAVADILMVVEILITAYCIYRFAKPFMNRKKGAFFSGVVYVLIILILYSIPLPLYALLVYGIKILVVLLTMCLSDRRNYEQKVFLVVTFFSLRRFALVLAEILYDHLYNWATHTQYMMAHPNMWFALYVGVSILYQVFEFSFMAIAICMILRTYLNKYAKMTKKEMLMLILPSFEMIAGSEIMHYYRSFYILNT